MRNICAERCPPRTHNSQKQLIYLYLLYQRIMQRCRATEALRHVVSNAIHLMDREYWSCGHRSEELNKRKIGNLQRLIFFCCHEVNDHQSDAFLFHKTIRWPDIVFACNCIDATHCNRLMPADYLSSSSTQCLICWHFSHFMRSTHCTSRIIDDQFSSVTVVQTMYGTTTRHREPKKKKTKQKQIRDE